MNIFFAGISLFSLYGLIWKGIIPWATKQAPEEALWPDKSPNWTKCSDQGGTCTLPEGKHCDFRYGANTNWVYLSKAEGSLYCDDKYFPNTIKDAAKTCEYLCDSKWVPCAREGSICYLPLEKQCDVRYGANLQWIYQPQKEFRVVCSNSYFNDPAQNVKKTCEQNCGVQYEPYWITCAKQGETCYLPEGKQCDVRYGINTLTYILINQKGKVSCNNKKFGDPNKDDSKQCQYYCKPTKSEVMFWKGYQQGKTQAKGLEEEIILNTQKQREKVSSERIETDDERYLEKEERRNADEGISKPKKMVIIKKRTETVTEEPGQGPKKKVESHVLSVSYHGGAAKKDFISTPG